MADMHLYYENGQADVICRETSKAQRIKKTVTIFTKIMHILRESLEF